MKGSSVNSELDEDLSEAGFPNKGYTLTRKHLKHDSHSLSVCLQRDINELPLSPPNPELTVNSSLFIFIEQLQWRIHEPTGHLNKSVHV